MPHDTPNRPRVVIIGCGFGGLEATKALGGAEVDVTLVDRMNHHLFQPLLYQVATAGLSAPAIAAPVRHLFRKQPNVTTLLDRLAGYAIHYYEDFVLPAKRFRSPDARERGAMEDLVRRLKALPADTRDGELIQNEVYEAGKRHFAQAELRQWFKTLYEVLLGSEQGPRMGAFIKLYGRDNVVRLIERALAGEDLGQAA